MKDEQMLKLRYETDMPAGDQIDWYLSCNVRISKGELKKKKMSPLNIYIHIYSAYTKSWATSNITQVVYMSVSARDLLTTGDHEHGNKSSSSSV